ncbi:MAG: hypothetical protein AAGD25_03225 [Cyanobacteria bacterium P01_F01_bin.150]
MVINIPSNPLASMSTSCLPKAINVTSAIKPTLQPSLRWITGRAIASSVSLLGMSSFALPVHAILLGNIPATHISATHIQNKSVPYVPPPDAGTPPPTGGTGSNMSLMLHNVRR